MYRRVLVGVAAAFLGSASCGASLPRMVLASSCANSNDESEDLQDGKGLGERDDFKLSVSKKDIMIIAGSSNPKLCGEVVRNLGVPLAIAHLGRFADGEVKIQVLDQIRGKDVYILQSVCDPINDNLMELLLLVSTARRASAARVTAVVPYYGYMRQDRKTEDRETIPAADVALMLEAVGVDRVVAVDLHRGQIQGFFETNTPVDNLSAVRQVVIPHILATRELNRPVIISPSQTGTPRAIQFRKELSRNGIDAGFALMVPQAGRQVVSEMDMGHHDELKGRASIVGDVKGCDVIIPDDIIDSGSRMILAAQAAHESGASRIYGFATHGVFSSPDCLTNLENSPFREVLVTDSVPMKRPSSVVNQLSIAKLLSDSIVCLHNDATMSRFTHQKC